MVQIVQRTEPILREIAREVPLSDIGTAKLNQVIEDMKTAMNAQKDGVAIAAPQIGVSLRMFIISGQLLSQADRKYTGERKDLVFINPVITKRSKDKKDVEEGCLSVRWLYGKIRRSTRVTLTAIDENGNKIERGATGLLAQIFQHETDHLDGVLFIDNAKEVWEMTEEEIRELERGN
jgi:peptide deformylase